MFRLLGSAQSPECSDCWAQRRALNVPTAGLSAEPLMFRLLGSAQSPNVPTAGLSAEP